MRGRIGRIGLVALLAVPSLAGQLQAPTDQKCGVEGQVVNSASGEPVRKAHITLMPMDAPGANTVEPGGAAILTAVTDAQGKFAFAGLAPGRYQLTGRRDGFVEQQYGAKRRWGLGTPLTVMAGEQKRDVVMRLVPLGAVSGRMVDEAGDPIQGVQVNLMVYQYTAKGRQLTTNQGASTNDLGEYRIFGVNPDRYYLKAGPPNMLRTGPSDSDGESFATAYYPGVFDSSIAAPIEVGPGQQLRGIDMTLRQTRPVRIRGRAIKPAGGCQMTLTLSTSDESGGSTSMTTDIQDSDGKFELRGVTPGAYSLGTHCNMGGDKRSSARLPIQVGSTDIEGIELHMVPPVDLAGRVSIEGKTEVKPAQVIVELEGQGSSASSYVREDGSFAFVSLDPGVYHVSAFVPGDGFLFEKAVRWGEMDATESGIDLSGGAAGEVVVILSANGGEIDGSVESDQTDPAASATVTLVPAGSRGGQSRFKVSMTDAQGNFRVRGIAPGSYRAFAWDEVDVNAVHYDPEFLRPFESAGQSVEIAENSKENVHLKLIRKPAEQ